MVSSITSSVNKKLANIGYGAVQWIAKFLSCAQRRKSTDTVDRFSGQQLHGFSSS